MVVRRGSDKSSYLRPAGTLLLTAVVAGGCAEGTAGEAGRTLYENQCQSCHRSISVFADMGPARLQAELAAPSLRKHRFRLSLEEQQALLDYLRKGQ